MRDSIAWRIVDALHGLAVANYHDFMASDELSKLYLDNLRAGKHVYVADLITCGWVDCWSTYRDMVRRNPDGIIRQDCEDAACSWAGWMTANCHSGIYVGLVPGKVISHAIAGADLKTPEADNATTGRNITIVDPARWYGMAETKYPKVFWKKVDPKACKRRF